MGYSNTVALIWSLARGPPLAHVQKAKLAALERNYDVTLQFAGIHPNLVFERC